MLILIPLLVLSTAPAEGASKSPPSTEAVALVWGGGKDAAAAQEWRRRWDEEQKPLAGALTLAEGFPKVVSSASVSGMNPGFEVVLLGFCQPEQGQQARVLLKALYPFIYERPVKVEAPACPTWSDDKERPVESPEIVKLRGATLTVVQAATTEEPSDRLVRVVVRDAKSQLLGAYGVDDGGSGMPGDLCETSSVEVRASDVVLERTCTHGVGAACNRYPGEKARIKVRWDGKALQAEEKTLSKWTIDMDKECAE